MRYYQKILYAFLLGFWALSCSSLQPEISKTFITVSGTQFIKGDQTYRFAGTNYWYGPYLGAEGETGNRDRLLRELDHLQSLGITNLRILAGSEHSSLAASLKPAMQTDAGVYNEDLFIGLDFLLAEMSKRKMVAVLFLTNFWEWSGGMSQYHHWFGGGPVVDPKDTTRHWGEFVNYSAAFYRNDSAQMAYYNHIRKIINRLNTVTGLYYQDDPTIMAWQLANEPRPGQGITGGLYAQYYIDWIEHTAKFIRSLDPNHLISTGSEGTVGSLLDTGLFIAAHQSPYIDYLTFHIWIKNWGWFNPSDVEGTYESGKETVSEYFIDHVELAMRLEKPMVLEEFGVGRDGEQYSPDSQVTLRDDYYSFIYNLIENDRVLGGPVAGSNFWAYGGEGRASQKDFAWKPGDPLTGDPPHEPQGWYSVFNTDTSTLSIIRHHAQFINQPDKGMPLAPVP